MPTKTRMLDFGGFVRAPEAPVDRRFEEYLEIADGLLESWEHAQAAWRQSPFSAEFLDRKKQAERLLSEFVAPWKAKYTIRAVERDPEFLPVARCFARGRPFGQPLTILHCDLDVPLHTVARYHAAGDLALLNAALAEEKPLRWWQDGPLGHPCYLFGLCVWELKASELNASDKGLLLLFETAGDRGRERRDRLTSGLRDPAATPQPDFIPERVRIAAWRRSGGRCDRCGGREGLDFFLKNSGRRYADPTPEQVEMLCQRCTGTG